MHLDAGHVCQNLYLSSEAVDCGVCAIAAFSDEDLSRLLGFESGGHLDANTTEALEGEPFVIYVAAVGKKIK
jgi:hypothetical protein